MDESIQEVLLKSWEVVGHILTLPHGERVAAVREDDGGKLLFIGEEVAAMDVSDGDFVFSPLGFAGGGERKEIVISAVINFGPGGWSHLCFCSRTMARQVSMKLLCVSTRKSVRAVVHAPAPTVVGMRYSREVSRVNEESRCLSSTLRRAVSYEWGREGGREGGGEGGEGGGEGREGGGEGREGGGEGREGEGEGREGGGEGREGRREGRREGGGEGREGRREGGGEGREGKREGGDECGEKGGRERG